MLKCLQESIKIFPILTFEKIIIQGNNKSNLIELRVKSENQICQNGKVCDKMTRKCQCIISNI